MQEKDGIVSNIQKARETTLKNIRLLELEQSQQTIKQENIANRLQEKYFQTIDRLRLLVEKTKYLLESDGFTVLTHSRVPTNDAGIALGQAVIAAHQVAKTRGESDV